MTNPQKFGLKFVEPFVKSTQEVFDIFLNCKCKPLEIQTITEAASHRKSVTASISMVGRFKGSLTISTSEEGAKNILEKIAGFECEEVDEMVLDSMGEMANMIAGKGKRDLSQYELQLGLPDVVVSQGDLLHFYRYAEHYAVPFNTDIGECVLEIGLDSLEDVPLAI